MTRVIVCGGRDYAYFGVMTEVLNHLHTIHRFDLLVHGDAGRYKIVEGRPVGYHGADVLAGEWAKKRGIQQIRVPANWEGLGNSAGNIRNKLMLDWFEPDVVVAFPGGRGTANMARIARESGVETIFTEDLVL